MPKRNKLTRTHKKKNNKKNIFLRTILNIHIIPNNNSNTNNSNTRSRTLLIQFKYLNTNIPRHNNNDTNNKRIHIHRYDTRIPNKKRINNIIINNIHTSFIHIPLRSNIAIRENEHSIKHTSTKLPHIPERISI